ncbi:hypothetical protein DS884_13030 [Tenacibaculum sp. E3R01]|uniref:hypothetical protein n=1 Tax=Tenacibaculum sp. E3R01 TaxID=2267227 RepID=UPI000DEAF350|nr:hypothetical protein [Tenacibaculum sp. E3R01]RBW56394.1 hypothetical protein DS884_13030 [Tenacibaculum sp. E3R01]
MTKYLIPFLLLTTIIGCNTPNKTKYTYFGGKIINPKGCYVILSDHKNFRDTIMLSKDNTFMGKYENFKEGLYIFDHGPEYQYVYIQPSDSLLFRLNTWDFDESLVFSGKNAERNNLLIETFLKHEEDKRRLFDNKKLEKLKFISKIDSLLLSKQSILKKYKKEHSEEPLEFLDILNISLTYPVYSNLETYSIDNIENEEPLDSNYFSYRDKIELGRDSLMFYGPYYRYVINKIYNEAYLKGSDEKSQIFVKSLLNNINEELTDEKIKDRFLYSTVVYHFNKRTKSNSYKDVFHRYFELSRDIENKKKIQRLINDIKQIKIDKRIPDFKLEAPTGNWVDVSKIIRNKKTVIFFKSQKVNSRERIASRVNYFIKKYPEINFILVNSRVKGKFTKNVPIRYQYKIPENSKAFNFLTSEFSRLVIVDENGIVKNDYTSTSAYDIEQQFKELQKK